MAGIYNQRCTNLDCRRVVMTADRGSIGNAFGSTVVIGEDGTPEATCPSCQTVTRWERRSPPVAVAPSRQDRLPGGLAQASVGRQMECIDADDHDPLNAPVAAGGGSRNVTTYLICRRCRAVYAVDTVI